MVGSISQEATELASHLQVSGAGGAAGSWFFHTAMRLCTTETINVASGQQLEPERSRSRTGAEPERSVTLDPRDRYEPARAAIGRSFSHDLVSSERKRLAGGVQALFRTVIHGPGPSEWPDDELCSLICGHSLANPPERLLLPASCTTDVLRVLPCCQGLMSNTDTSLANMSSFSKKSLETNSSGISPSISSLITGAVNLTH